MQSNSISSSSHVITLSLSGTGDFDASTAIGRPTSPQGARQDGGDELQLAEELERLEIRYWRLVSSSRAAHDAIEDLVREHLPAAAAEVRERIQMSRLDDDRAAPDSADLLAAASAIQAADVDRTCLNATHQALCERCGGTASCGAEVSTAAHDAWAAQQAVKNSIVTAHYRLVLSVARRYRTPHMTLDDLVQEGTFGLIKAVERFDYRMGFRFNTYAVWWVREAAREHPARSRLSST